MKDDLAFDYDSAIRRVDELPSAEDAWEKKVDLDELWKKVETLPVLREKGGIKYYPALQDTNFGGGKKTLGFWRPFENSETGKKFLRHITGRTFTTEDDESVVRDVNKLNWKMIDTVTAVPEFIDFGSKKKKRSTVVLLQYRTGPEAYCGEFVAGKCDKPDLSDLDPTADTPAYRLESEHDGVTHARAEVREEAMSNLDGIPGIQLRAAIKDPGGSSTTNAFDIFPGAPLSMALNEDSQDLTPGEHIQAIIFPDMDSLIEFADTLAERAPKDHKVDNVVLDNQFGSFVEGLRLVRDYSEEFGVTWPSEDSDGEITFSKSKDEYKALQKDGGFKLKESKIYCEDEELVEVKQVWEDPEEKTVIRNKTGRKHVSADDANSVSVLTVKHTDSGCYTDLIDHARPGPADDVLELLAGVCKTGELVETTHPTCGYKMQVSNLTAEERGHEVAREEAGLDLSQYESNEDTKLNWSGRTSKLLAKDPGLSNNTQKICRIDVPKWKEDTFKSDWGSSHTHKNISKNYNVRLRDLVKFVADHPGAVDGTLAALTAGVQYATKYCTETAEETLTQSTESSHPVTASA